MRRYIIDIDFTSIELIRYIETFDQDFYPVFFRHKTLSGYNLWYWDKNQQYCEFLDIIIDCKQRTVLIERDLKATLILFYYFHDTRLIISSDWTYFAEQLPLWDMLDSDYIKLFLWPGREIKWTLCHHISILYPRKKYFFCEDWLQISSVSYIPQKITLENIVHQNFCHLNEKNSVAAEISWWKDSAFLPILAKKSHCFPFTLVTGQLHSGEEWKQQRKTLAQVIDFLDIPYAYHHISKECYPLKNEPVWVIKHPIEEIYKNNLLGEIEIMKKWWINTVFNGFGWDEAFESKTAPNDYISRNAEELAFLFDRWFIDDVEQLNRSDRVYTDDLFQTSVYEACICRNNLYIQHGIWPLSPYFNLDIYEFFQSLQVTKQQFFTTFYKTFDTKLLWAFDQNTNMATYFHNFVKSDFFSSLLQAYSDNPSPLLVWWYNRKNVQKYFLDTKHCDDILLSKWSFSLYKFVYMAHMLHWKSSKI